MRATGRQGRDGAEEGGGGPCRANTPETRPETGLLRHLHCVINVQRQLWFTNPEDTQCVVYGEGSIIFQHGPLVLKID